MYLDIQGGEGKAYNVFCGLRWPQTDGKPVCPRCGCLDAYAVSTRRKFKCAACGHQFSVTPGTILASRKLTFADLLAAICILSNAAKGVSALQLSRDLDVQHKTAFVLAHKIREALAAESKNMKLEGDIEIDGAYFGGHARPKNFAKDRIDRRLAENQTGKRRVVIAARARKGRTLTFVARHEAEGVRFLNIVADPWTRVHANEASHWDALHAHYPVKRINHSLGYSDETCTNKAESYFSRLRRMVQGQHCYVSPQHLHQYAAHAAWNEDPRRTDNGGLTYRTAALALKHPVSRAWKGVLVKITMRAYTPLTYVRQWRIYSLRRRQKREGNSGWLS